MRRSIATISAVLLGLAVITPGAAQAAPSAGNPAPTKGGDLSPGDKAALAAGIGVAPKAPYGTKPTGPNPFLAEVADASKVDYAGWANYLKVQSKTKAAQRAKSLAASNPALAAQAAAAPAIVVDEDEIDGTTGGNDTPANAQRITPSAPAPASTRRSGCSAAWTTR
ncbi:hypothetical protein [Paractinoplanes durhamensis]|uniref:hypothetical protein n=1 Tax=Paractinoplanes durhamensis TaxID=113563 RepID=UPI00363EF3E3